MSIHPTAVIDPKAEIDSEVEIGPYVVIEGPVRIKRGTRVMAHAYLAGWTEIGESNEIHPGVVLGDAPQDKAYKGEETYLRHRCSQYFSRACSGSPRHRPGFIDNDRQ